MKLHRFAPLVLIPSLMLAATGQAQEEDFAALDLETLMNMDVTVTSATKRAQASSDAAAAVYVITREDIRRSGATSLPELLRVVPGMQVARINSRSWAVTARGFNSRFASKLLVMIDGRSIYTPQFSGVIWEEQTPVIGAIERVEIVRGPGGTLWGINAVNGVINVITRKAEDARGLELEAGAGSFEPYAATLSYGGTGEAIGEYTIYLDHSERDSFESGREQLDHTHVGIRLDRPFADGALTVQGNVQESDLGSVPPPPALSLATSVRSGDVSATWQRAFASAGDLELATYYAWSERSSPGRWDESAFGFDMQFSAERIGRHLVTVGTGFRYLTDELNEVTPSLQLTDRKVAQQQWSIYAQDEIHFFADRVRVILGAKLEDLEFTGSAFQPTARALWHVSDTHTLWAAASRAVRTPSRIELHSVMSVGVETPDGPVLIRMYGYEGLQAEELYAYEIGWRWRPARALSFDVAAYRNEYQDLIGGNPLPPVFEFNPMPMLVLPSVYANMGESHVDGVELVAQWRANEWLNIEGQGTWTDSGALGLMFPGSIDPKRMFSIRTRVDLSDELELDLTWRSVSELAGFGLPGHESIDVRVGWQATDSLQLSVAIENVLDEERTQFIDELGGIPGVSLGRTVLARIHWRPDF